MDTNNKDHVILLLTETLARAMRLRIPQGHHEQLGLEISLDNGPQLDPTEWRVDVVQPFHERGKLRLTLRAVIGPFGVPEGALRDYGQVPVADGHVGEVKLLNEERQEAGMQTFRYVCPLHGPQFGPRCCGQAMLARLL